MAVQVKVGPIGLLDMLKFKNQAKTREQVIKKTPAAPLPKEYNTNRNARLLHPEYQKLVVEDILVHSQDVKTFVFHTKNGEPGAYFRAGQYLSFQLEIGESKITRPISICSSPAEALKGKYAITVKRAGFASDHMLDHWEIGQQVTASAPQGNFYYERLRDSKKVIGLAGGSGITPFLSMALAIAGGEEDFELTVLYGSRGKKDILFLDEFTRLSKECSQIKLVNVLSEETAEDCEKGFLTAELIKKYMGGQSCSIFMCGPQAMYNFVNGELEKLEIPGKYIRRELFGASKQPWTLPGYPSECRGKEVKVTLSQCGKKYEFAASTDETLLVAIERAGITAPSRCRSGECGWCRSKLLQGEVFIPQDTDGRRKADKEYGYIHPCVSYPLTDIVMDIPNA